MGIKNKAILHEQAPKGKSRWTQLHTYANASLPTGAAANEGSIAYDTTNHNVMYQDQNGAWQNVGIAGSGTLDQAYDSGGVGVGAVITIDGASFELDYAGGGTGTVQTTKALTGQTITTGHLFSHAGTGTITTAIDVSDANITTGIALGASAITGTNFSVNTGGTVTCTGINSSGTAALTTVTCTTLTVSGNGLDSTAFSSPVFRSAASGNTNVTYDAAGTGTIGIGTVSTGAITLGQSTTLSSGKNLTLTSGNITLSAGTMAVTTGVGGNDGVAVTPITTKAVLSSTLPAAYTYATGAVNIQAGTGSGPLFAAASSGAYTGDFVQLNMTNAVGAKAINITGAGTRTANLINIVDTQDTSALTVNISTTPTTNAGTVLIATAGTGSGSVIKETFSAAYTGKGIELNMTNAVAANAIVLTGAGTRTVPLLSITDTPGAAGGAISVSTTSASATAIPLKIVEAGTSTNDIVQMTMSGAYAGKAAHITMTNAAAGANALVIDGGQTAATVNVVDISSSSAFAAGTGRVVKITSSGNVASATNGICLAVAETGAAQATSYAVDINSTNNQALRVTSGKSHFVPSVSFLGGGTESVAFNFISSETGAANAIVASLNDDTGTAVPLADGLCVTIKLAHTLQAGVNTFNFNAGGAKSIVSSRNPANNIATAYAATGYITLMYNATSTVWMDCSQ